jgi:hypothetical protein
MLVLADVGVWHQVAPDLDIGPLSDEVGHTSASATRWSTSVSKTSVDGGLITQLQCILIPVTVGSRPQEVPNREPQLGTSDWLALDAY